MADEETPRIEGEQMHEHLQQMNRLFSKYKDDPELDYIHANRLLEILQIFGRNPSRKECEQRVNEFAENGKFEFTFEDFLQILDESWTSMNNDRSVLRQAFEKFDHLKDGFIDIEQFRTVMRTLGEPLSDDEIDGLIQLGLNDEQRKVDIDSLLDQLLGNNA